MTIVNKRNAVVGFVAIKVGKIVARRKAKKVGGKLVPPWGGGGKNDKNQKNDKKSD
jgi:hypothetical protein